MRYHSAWRPRARLAGTMLAALLILATASVTTATEFPAGHTGYHSYTEMRAEVAAVAAAHPAIVSRFSIGKSYKGRDIWAVKISDNVAVDEPEPEVMFDGTTHSDEHMGTEMTLHILHWLVDGYGHDARITRIVNTREIWIVFTVNPDGAEYDISGGRYHFWRKNRQPTPGSSSIGTDLNRNFGYKWGGGGRTSSNPAAITYRGPGAFSAPETRAMRDFMASRVVNGRQQIRTAITFHESGRLVMWPYGYTLANVPSDMTRQDHDALALIGKHMAATNGYRPEQASDLYVTSGTTRDYQYGVYRIFAYTFELSVKDYPDDSLIASETGRNKEAVLYLMERASCPYGVLGAAVQTARCGALDDDLEIGRGWTGNPDGTDTAPANARFTRSNPASTASSGPKQLGTTPSGSKAFVTGAAAGANANANDLDGRTTVRSPAISLPAAAGQRLTFAYVFAHSATSTSADSLRAIVERSDGSQVEVFSVHGRPVDVDGAWRTASISLDAFAGQTVRLRFIATDGGPGNLVEVELDDIRVTRPS
ncbi:MAG: M14 family zinc carboxypeptidase [Chloroflexota bacterium]